MAQSEHAGSRSHVVRRNAASHPRSDDEIIPVHMGIGSEGLGNVYASRKGTEKYKQAIDLLRDPQERLFYGTPEHPALNPDDPVQNKELQHVLTEKVKALSKKLMTIAKDGEEIRRIAEEAVCEQFADNMAYCRKEGIVFDLKRVKSIRIVGERVLFECFHERDDRLTLPMFRVNYWWKPIRKALDENLEHSHESPAEHQKCRDKAWDDMMRNIIHPKNRLPLSNGVILTLDKKAAAKAKEKREAPFKGRTQTKEEKKQLRAQAHEDNIRCTIDSSYTACAHKNAKGVWDDHYTPMTSKMRAEAHDDALVPLNGREWFEQLINAIMPNTYTNSEAMPDAIAVAEQIEKHNAEIRTQLAYAKIQEIVGDIHDFRDNPTPERLQWFYKQFDNPDVIKLLAAANMNVEELKILLVGKIIGMHPHDAPAAAQRGALRSIRTYPSEN